MIDDHIIGTWLWNTNKITQDIAEMVNDDVVTGWDNARSIRGYIESNLVDYIKDGQYLPDFIRNSKGSYSTLIDKFRPTVEERAHSLIDARRPK